MADSSNTSSTPSSTGGLRISTLDNGLTLAVVESRRAPIVTTVLWFRVGATADAELEAGTAHFLEHMMFKGSASFGAGEIDRITQSLGGSNNAFTGHDSTAYHFQFAADRWPKALEMEADRMAGLLLDPEDFTNERQVILEEIAMYESEPWDVLEARVHKTLFGGHPYGRPVLGTRDELMAMTPETLRRFHSTYYRPGNAVLVVAGDVGSDVEELVQKSFGSLPPGKACPPRPAPVSFPEAREKLEVRRGELPRLLVSLPAPPCEHPDHPRLRLLLHWLSVGRSSVLHRVLVEEEQLCAWLSADLSDSLEPGFLSFSLELPGTEPQRVEERLFELLGEARERAPSMPDLTRARQLYRADWVFAREHVYQQALMAGSSIAHHDAGFAERYRRQVLDCPPEGVHEVAARYLDLDAGVVGWSLPSRGNGEYHFPC